MRVPFIKMHGLGNDFVVLDGREQALPSLNSAFAVALADRRTGIGCDQLVVLEPSGTADLKARFSTRTAAKWKAAAMPRARSAC